jgi:hypothetical protein
MPILDDIMEQEVLGQERKRGMALGRAEGERLLDARSLADLLG